MKTINAMWMSFQKVALPRNASITQFREVKSGFYAGASAILHLISNMDKNMTDEEIGQMLDSMSAEIESYTQQLNRKIN